MTIEQILKGKVALVTGGGRGIGKEHALALAAAGARVVVNDVGSSARGDGAEDGPAREVADEIRAMGGEAIANTASVSSWHGGREAVQAAIDAFGDIDIIVNNAGISRMVEIDDLTQEDWDLTIAVNLTGTAATTHWASVHWRNSGVKKPRAIINTSSPAGTNPAPMSPAYVATKAGISALTTAVSLKLCEFGVRVNAIAPMAQTRMVDDAPAFVKDVMNRTEGDFHINAPANIAPLVVYLASSECRFTGRTFGIEGGELYLFDGFSARQRFSNGPQRWTQGALADALRDVDPQDRGMTIAPGAHFPGPNPPDAVLAALENIEA